MSHLARIDKEKQKNKAKETNKYVRANNTSFLYEWMRSINSCASPAGPTRKSSMLILMQILLKLFPGRICRHAHYYTILSAAIDEILVCGSFDPEYI